jgi:hypothetical protein
MIVSTVVSAGVCHACFLAAHNPSAALSFDGAETRRLVYVFAGSGVARHDDLGLSQDWDSGSVLDLKAAISSALTEVDVTSEYVFWVAFFVNDKSHDLDYALLKQGVHELSLSSPQESVFVLRGSINVNGKPVPDQHFFTVREGEKYAVSVPDGALAIHLKRA